MANVRFPLIMKDGTKVRELEEFQNHFDLERAVEYFANGKLQKWLESTYNDDILDEISGLTGKEEDFVVRFAEALGVDLDEIEVKTGNKAFDPQKSMRESHIKEVLKASVPLEKIEELLPFTVESQEGFETYVKEGKNKIYLLEGQYFIPKWMNNIRIEGIGEVTARVEAENKEDFINQNVKVTQVKPTDERTKEVMTVDAISSNVLELLETLKLMIEKEGKSKHV
ncbi:hypothetical protein [Faecalicatena contorta]|uniref:hypothetical protein n=1 Tax=Faecalicatena contorta TaxID=39482 RepID=UPI001F3DA076|nr:hypothetical protein [Faecalicatena contorta]MCF2554376.1 hypothetical protein [Faecalicatena contorta]